VILQPTKDEVALAQAMDRGPIATNFIRPQQGMDRAAGHDEVTSGKAANELSVVTFEQNRAPAGSPNLSNSDQHQNLHWMILYDIADVSHPNVGGERPMAQVAARSVLTLRPHVATCVTAPRRPPL